MANSLRPAAVAGSFYSQNAQTLSQQLQEMLSGPPIAVTEPPLALIVPHAGYFYSGRIAAQAYRYLQPFRERVQRVVIVTPNHRVPLQGVAVPDLEVFATPLGEIRLDRETCEALTGLPNVVANNHPHQAEHGIEVQLPFLQQLLGDSFQLIPLVVGEGLAEQVAALFQQLLVMPATLLIVSSDLSHFLHYAEANRRDQQTIAQICAADASLQQHDACGYNAVNGLLLLARRKGYRVQQLAAANSGDISGEWSRVVGYASFAVFAE